MTFPRIQRLLAALLVVLALAATGCSSNSTKTTRDPELTREEADDIAQQLAATMATDIGGWLIEIERGMFKRNTQGDTTDVITRGTIMHTMSYIYDKRTGGTSSVWDSTVIIAHVSNNASGIFGLGDIQGRFVHESEPTFFGADEDTMSFDAIAIDSTQFTIVSFTRGDTVSYTMDLFYECDDLRILANQVDPWPISGEVLWIIDGRRVGVNRSILVEAKLILDGSVTPRLDVYSDESNAAEYFRFRVNLKTGAVARI